MTTNSDIQHRGNCQVCGRPQAVTTGVITGTRWIRAGSQGLARVAATLPCKLTSPSPPPPAPSSVQTVTGWMELPLPSKQAQRTQSANPHASTASHPSCGLICRQPTGRMPSPPPYGAPSPAPVTAGASQTHSRNSAPPSTTQRSWQFAVTPLLSQSVAVT